MKYLLFIFFIYQFAFAQTPTRQKFKYEKHTYDFTILAYTPNYIGRVVVVAYDTKEEVAEAQKLIEKCYKQHKLQTRFYFVQIPENVDKKNFFNEFMFNITNTGKVIDSAFYMFSDSNYSEEYQKFNKEDAKRRNVFLTKFEDIQILQPKEICNKIDGDAIKK